MDRIVIDGAMGEGGGQVLRSSLTLAMLKQSSIEVINIRANRAKPGLMRQHLTCVDAARQVCNAEVEGAELGSQRIRFTPGKIKPGDYHFVIGSAGSTSLVCQTVLPVLAVADAPSRLSFEGGTHNSAAPSLSFMQHSYLPVLAMMGVKTRVETKRLGFYPAGGGKWCLHLEPTGSVTPLDLAPDGDSNEWPGQLGITAWVSNLPETIARRETVKVKRLLNLPEHHEEVQSVESAGPGNILMLSLASGFHQSRFEVVGELGLSADKVANRAVGRLRQFMKSGAAVEEHLADQLLLLLVMAGGGRFTTSKPSLHTRTNIEVIRQFGYRQLKIHPQSEVCWLVDYEGDN